MELITTTILQMLIVYLSGVFILFLLLIAYIFAVDKEERDPNKNLLTMVFGSWLTLAYAYVSIIEKEG